jgi:hypothetical protein
MNVGDLVRCRRRVFVQSDISMPENIWDLGMIVEKYDKYQKLVTVMIDGSVLRYHAHEVQLAKRAPAE